MSSPNQTAIAAQAKAWIDDVKALQKRTRRARRGLWFPLVVFGLVILASTPLYLDTTIAPTTAFLTSDVFSPPTTGTAEGGYVGLLRYFTDDIFHFLRREGSVFVLVPRPLVSG